VAPGLPPTELGSPGGPGRPGPAGSQRPGAVGIQAHWEAKAERLLQEADQQPGGVRSALEFLDPDLEMWDLSADSLLSVLGNHHNVRGGLGLLLQYLRHPSQELKQDLLEVYDPDPDEVLSPKEDLEEQENLIFIEFLFNL